MTSHFIRFGAAAFLVALTLGSAAGVTLADEPLASGEAIQAIENQGDAQREGGERPGWGCGDMNHEHSGPAGVADRESPCKEEAATEPEAEAVPASTGDLVADEPSSEEKAEHGNSADHRQDAAHRPDGDQGNSAGHRQDAEHRPDGEQGNSADHRQDGDRGQGRGRS